VLFEMFGRKDTARFFTPASKYPPPIQTQTALSASPPAGQGQIGAPAGIPPEQQMLNQQGAGPESAMMGAATGGRTGGRIIHQIQRDGSGMISAVISGSE